MTGNCKILLDMIGAKNIRQKKYLIQAVENMHEDDFEEMDRYICFALSINMTIEDLANSYLWFCEMCLTETMYFKRNGNYRYTTLAETKKYVYDVPNIMNLYLYGLGLSNFLFAQHRNMRNFFVNNLPDIRRNNYLEIGPGHGFFLTQAVRSKLWDSYTAIDISAESLAVTGKILNSGLWGKSDSVQLVNKDFFTLNESITYDAVVMGEVLEHVEHPFCFLQKIRRVCNKNAWIYISTALNSPAIDHIYNFSSLDEITNMFNDADIEVVEKYVFIDGRLTLEDAYNKKEPILIAIIGTPI